MSLIFETMLGKVEIPKEVVEEIITLVIQMLQSCLDQGIDPF